jgi:hypothetical protein
MTTYTTTFDLATAQTGASGHYPLLVKDSTYTPDNTIYAKVGDTVKFVVSEPSPDGASVSYNNIDNVAWTDTEPDPDEFDAGTTNQSSPSSWEYTITSAAEDSEFYWWWFGTTVHSSGSGKKYSQRVRVNRIVGAPRINGGTSAVTVTQGGTITFSVTGLSGLLTSGTNSNCLYFSVFNSSNQWVTTTGTSGLSWDSGTNQLGKVKTSDGNTVLTVGSSMATGTYNVYLTHFNAADSPGGNDFMGSENRLGPDGSTHGTSAAALQFTVQATGDSTPNQIDLRYSTSIDNLTGALRNQTYQTENASLTGFNQTVQPTITGGEYQVNSAGSWHSTAGDRASVSTGDNIRVRGTASSSYSGVTNVALTIGSMTETWSITAQADPGGGGGDIGGPSGSSAYGLAVYNSAGTQQIFGPTLRALHVLGYGTIASIGAFNSATQYYGFLSGSGNTAVENMTTSSESTIGIILGGNLVSGVFGAGWTITYLNGYFTIRNLSAIAFTNVTWYAVRY